PPAQKFLPSPVISTLRARLSPCTCMITSCSALSSSTFRPLADSARFNRMCATPSSYRSSRTGPALTMRSGGVSVISVSSDQKGHGVQGRVVIHQHHLLERHAKAIALATQGVFVSRRPDDIAARLRFEHHGIGRGANLIAVVRND